MSTKLLRTARWLRRRAQNVAALMLATMFVCFLIQILFRYVFNYPVGWTEELSILCWMWGVLWGAAFILTERDEVRFDILYGNVPESVRRIFTVISGVALILLYGISLPAAYGFVTFMKVERSAYLHITINYLYSIYLVFAVASICRYAWLVWSAIRGGSRLAESAEGSGRP
jgi:TRAP-type C4-dicarboxylate transport system permease small subunit